MFLADNSLIEILKTPHRLLQRDGSQLTPDGQPIYAVLRPVWEWSSSATDSKVATSDFARLAAEGRALTGHHDALAMSLRWRESEHAEEYRVAGALIWQRKHDWPELDELKVADQFQGIDVQLKLSPGHVKPTPISAILWDLIMLTCRCCNISYLRLTLPNDVGKSATERAKYFYIKNGTVFSEKDASRMRRMQTAPHEAPSAVHSLVPGTHRFANTGNPFSPSQLSTLHRLGVDLRHWVTDGVKIGLAASHSSYSVVEMVKLGQSVEDRRTFICRVILTVSYTRAPPPTKSAQILSVSQHKGANVLKLKSV